MNKQAVATLLGALLATQAAQAQSLVEPERYRALAADHRAYRLGDVITVYVAEATRAKSQAATDASSRLDLGAGLRSPSTDFNADVGLSGSNSGGAQTTRVGELRTQVSVQVVALEPDGSLRIEGAQTLTVNGENQRIRLKGLVRPQDVSAQNTVWSNRIANAELELDGVGIVSESQRQSVIYRFFKWLRLM
ncbi:flagellar basal body L-ring protein FlgH [Stenotrophomonas maltophilia]|uniref:Flagellar basal body L-ring protein FlgH n=1 Tax=Stenotrophomonas maltophilia TaxID=40324 RepID=A0A6B8J2Y3_STEMA|nr:flagellar basal body L-ring protein FlgH [Stenotrophomonas maltophilia]MBH1652088.1 flagellar basal body L-ring protein FlgH [Stenotrophomonas maltophilia]QGM00282.1 flagellar basal body L-ring protein FlgH [Stenotrophomonas maltophilia]HDS1508855.1 flagellar basal body L-ring protein FlgH [Stenotrophomonas maltophilia]